jgi:hypothetical protein
MLSDIIFIMGLIAAFSVLVWCAGSRPKEEPAWMREEREKAYRALVFCPVDT